MIGPEAFRDYYLPHYNEAAEALHKTGTLIGTHLDADNTLIMELVARTSLDYIEAYRSGSGTISDGGSRGVAGQGALDQLSVRLAHAVREGRVRRNRTDDPRGAGPATGSSSASPRTCPKTAGAAITTRSWTRSTRRRVCSRHPARRGYPVSACYALRAQLLGPRRLQLLYDANQFIGRRWSREADGGPCLPGEKTSRSLSGSTKTLMGMLSRAQASTCSRRSTSSQ